MIFRMHTMCKDQRRGGYLDITTIYIIYTKLYNKVLYLSTSNVTVAALTPAPPRGLTEFCSLYDHAVDIVWQQQRTIPQYCSLFVLLMLQNSRRAQSNEEWHVYHSEKREETLLRIVPIWR